MFLLQTFKGKEPIYRVYYRLENSLNKTNNVWPWLDCFRLQLTYQYLSAALDRVQLQPSRRSYKPLLAPLQTRFTTVPNRYGEMLRTYFTI